MTMRADLDCLLAREAEAHGAELRESCRVLNITKQADFIEINSDSGTFRAKFVIAADGVHSMTAKSAGWSGLPQLAPALEWEVHLKEQDFERFKDTARFDFNFIEPGYAWVFPKREHLSVGLLSTRRRSPDLQTKLQEYLRHLGIVEIQKCERHGYLIPIAHRRGKLANDRVLLVGDAAGLTDPVTAEGISYAIISGQMAARALAECDLNVARVSERFDTLLRDIVLEELAAATFLANFLYNYPRLRSRIFQRNGKRLTEFVAGVAMGESSYREALRSPLSYLKMIWPARQLLH
jgi:flavin-dependent dehydrogenase